MSLQEAAIFLFHFIADVHSILQFILLQHLFYFIFTCAAGFM